MRHYTRYITMMAALLLSMTTWAEGEFTYNYKLNGNTSTEAAAGSVVATTSDNTATLTLTPVSGNYITVGYITVTKTLKGSHAQSRTQVAENVTLTVSDPDADPSGVTTYTFAIEDENYDYDVTADFQSRKDISGATITLAETQYTYDATEKKPSVSSVSLNGTALATSDYTIAYDKDCKSAGDHTVIITGVRTYKGTASATYNISATDMTVTAEGYKGVYDGEEHGIKVTAPEGATVLYGYTKGNYRENIYPAYTNAGTYWVHYQVTKTNYTTVADSAKVEISKADINPTVSMDNWTEGKLANTPKVTGNNGNGKTIFTYKPTDDEEFSEEVPSTAGKYTVKATIDESTNYNGGEATAEFEIYAKPVEIVYYDLWIGGKQVTSENADDFLGNVEKDDDGIITKPASIIFNSDNNTLVLSNDDTEQTIESKLTNLTIFISGNNKVKSIVGHDGTLTFTTEEVESGTLAVGMVDGAADITGFKSISYEYFLQLINDEENTSYATIGVKLKSKTDGEKVTFNENDLIKTDENGDPVLDENGNKQEVDMSNFIYKGVLVNIDQNTDGEGLVTNENGETGIALVNTMTSEKSNEIAKKIANGELIPGSYEYAEQIKGLTVNVSGVEGLMSIDAETNEGSRLMVSPSDYDNTPWSLSLEGALEGLRETALRNGVYPKIRDYAWDDNDEGLLKDFGIVNDGEARENGSWEEKSDQINEFFDKIRKDITALNGKLVSLDWTSNDNALDLPEDEVLVGVVGVAIKSENRAKTWINTNGEDIFRIYAEEQSKPSPSRITRLGKRDKAHGTIYSVQVSPSKVKASHSASKASGGLIPPPPSSDQNEEEEEEEPVPTFINGVKETTIVNNKWYTIDGQQIDKPTQKGIYIRNHQKIVIQ